MAIGAQAAIRGYRRQALYTASVLLSESGSDTTIEPEGLEDFALYRQERLERAVQVKALSSPLTLSDLKPARPDSFLRRLLVLSLQGVAVELVSFGPLGAELQALKEGDERARVEFAGKLREYGYTEDEAHQILRHLSIIVVDEEEVNDRIAQFLSSTVTAGEVDRAFELVVWWLLDAAEKRRRLSTTDLRDRLQAIGRYLAERAAHHSEWFTTIKPLMAVDPASALGSEQLAEEYYRGAAARYSHIVAGLDVRRERLLSAIDSHFDEGKRVVILHGASGQGKTSLALRYLHESVPEDWRFIVTAVDSRRHAASIANALADHLRALKLPLYVFLDVAPRDLEWVSLVRELLDFREIRILVAIREEDLARQTAASNELGTFGDVRLELSPAEAEPVYDTLSQRPDSPNVFPTFREAWERFGGEGPLLEFVYLVTQAEALRSVLQQQVRRLRDEVQEGKREPQLLRLLQYCAVATAFESHVVLRPLAEHLGVSDPTGTMALLEREYLLRLDPHRALVEGLHPLRSNLLAEILDDAALAPTAEIAREVLPFLPEDDIEVFLLYLLARYPESLTEVGETLSSLPLGWRGAVGIGRALLWCGMKSYLNENRDVLDEYAAVTGDSRSLIFLLPDLAGASQEDILENLLGAIESANPALPAAMRALRDRLTLKERAFEPLRQWLAGLSIETAPANVQDWEALAELTFWAGCLGVRAPGPTSLSAVPTEELPVEAVARICLGLERINREGFLEELPNYEEQLKRKFREETSTPLVAEGDGSITAHFIVPADLILPEVFGPSHTTVASGRPHAVERIESQRVESNRGLPVQINEEAVRRASLLRALFPNRSQFRTQGYGHNLGIEGLELPYDGTHKAMEAKALPVPWLTRLNALTNGLWLYLRRPTTWREYARSILRRREAVATALLRLSRNMVAYFEGQAPRSLLTGGLTEETWEEARRSATDAPDLPRSAVDEWGLSSETRAMLDSTDARVSSTMASIASLLAQRPLSQALRDYFSAVGNFFSQAKVISATHGYFGRRPEQRAQLQALADSAGYSPDAVRLSIFNLFAAMQHLDGMQVAFDERLGSLVDSTKLAQVRRRESELFPELWTLWYQFCLSPVKHFVNAAVQSRSELERAREDLLKAVIGGPSENCGWRVRLLRSDYLWDAKNALVFELAVDSLETLKEAKEALYSSLEATFGGQDLGSLGAYALDFYWANVLVIPTMGGRVLGGTWVLPAPSLALSSGGSLMERGHLKVLHALSSEQAAELGLEPAEPGWIPGLPELQAIASQLQASFGHLTDFLELVPQLDSEGEAVLSAYFRELSPQVSELITRCRRLLTKVARGLEAATSLAPGLRDEAVSLLANTTATFDEVLVEGKAMGFEDYARLKNELEELSGSLLVLGWMTMYGTQ